MVVLQGWKRSVTLPDGMWIDMVAEDSGKTEGYPVHLSTSPRHFCQEANWERESSQIFHMKTEL